MPHIIDMARAGPAGLGLLGERQPQKTPPGRSGPSRWTSGPVRPNVFFGTTDVVSATSTPLRTPRAVAPTKL